MVLEQRQRFIAKMLGFYRPLEVLLGYFWGHKGKQPWSQATRSSIKHVEFANFGMRKWLKWLGSQTCGFTRNGILLHKKLWKDPPFSYSDLSHEKWWIYPLKMVIYSGFTH